MRTHSPTCLEGPITVGRDWWRKDAEPTADKPEPLFRAGLVEEIRRQIAAGTYETPSGVKFQVVLKEDGDLYRRFPGAPDDRLIAYKKLQFHVKEFSDQIWEFVMEEGQIFRQLQSMKIGTADIRELEIYCTTMYTPIAMEVRHATTWTGDMGFRALHACPYFMPSYRLTMHYPKSHVPFGTRRATGAAPNAFYMESFIDELAAAAGQADGTAARVPRGHYLDRALTSRS